MSNEPLWLKAARLEIGVHEGVGPKDNPRVLQYYIDASHTEIKHDEVAWCAAFLNSMLKRGGVKGNESLMARSFERWGQPLTKPILGCVGVKRRSGAKPPPGLGHVGFVVGANPTTIFLLGGNQSDQVSIAAFRRSEFTAFRYPANIAIPKPALLLPTSLAGAQSNQKEA